MPLNCHHGISIFDYFGPETKPTASRALHLSSLQKTLLSLRMRAFQAFGVNICKYDLCVVPI